jgi:peptidyl-prolyl cis-trans isomerase SurA
MKNITRRIVLTAAFLMLLLASLSAQLLDKTLATVRLTETEVVYERELIEQISLLEAQLGRTLSADQKRDVLDSRIDILLFSQAARRANLQASDLEIQNVIQQQKASLGVQVSDAQYRQLIEQQTGLSWDDYLSQIEDRILQEKYIQFARPNLGQNIPQPTEAEIIAVYEENAQNFLSPAMSGVSHIFIPTRGLSSEDLLAARTRMDAFARRVRNGGSSEFDTLVRESLDDTAFTGGELGYVISGDQSAIQQLGQSFVQQVLAMAEGDISGVMESSAGLHIVRINDRRRPRLLELSDPLLPGQSVTVRQNIISFIRSNKQQQALIEAVEEISADLRDEADIRIFDNKLPW